MEHGDITWITDSELKVTALSRRLRQLVGPAPAGTPALGVADLFAGDDPFQVATVAHEWAREGERLQFEHALAGEPYRIKIEPLHGVSGSIVGVHGAAEKLEDADGVRALQTRLAAMHDAETFSGLGSWHTDLRTAASLWSAGLCTLLGVTVQPEHASVRDFDHPDDAQMMETAMRNALAHHNGYRQEHRIVRGDGQTRFVQEQLTVHFDDGGDPVAITGSMLDVTERKIAESRLTYLAHYDRVSNLPNRALLEERLGAAIARAERSGRLCAVLFLDIDRFKEVNDSLGHAAGDELLAAVGSRLQSHVRAADTVARIGGDEFIIVLDGLATNHDCHEGARKILEVFRDPFAIGGTRRTVSASVGMSIYPFTARGPKELIAAADDAMYAVKECGGNAVEPARPQVPRRDLSNIGKKCASSFAEQRRSVRKASGAVSG